METTSTFWSTNAQLIASGGMVGGLPPVFNALADIVTDVRPGSNIPDANLYTRVVEPIRPASGLQASALLSGVCVSGTLSDSDSVVQPTVWYERFWQVMPSLIDLWGVVWKTAVGTTVAVLVKKFWDWLLR